MNIFEYAKAKREKALSDEAASEGESPAQERAETRTMSQSQFGKADSPEARARKQRALADMLRNRQ